MQYEKTTDQLTENNHLELIKISPCRKFHTLFEKPLYEERFLYVEKFHNPGFAPVCDITGAYHINLKGKVLYKKRYNKTYGFYCGRAAVEDNTGCHHIDSDGSRVYKQSYQWVGNYQENICVVRRSDKYYHIDLYGNRLYQEEYDYVGDFKDEIAVVYKDNLATHIDSNGSLIHNKWYNQLGLFHKNYATAEDEKGWFHINFLGCPIYDQRYKMVEPFYNGLARVEEFEGKIKQIDINGNTVYDIYIPSEEFRMHRISANLVGFWNTYLAKAFIELDILHFLPATSEELSIKTKIPKDNLVRLLRALWETGFLTFNQSKDHWELTDKSKTIQSIPFLPKAIRMWSRVVSLDKWLEINTILKTPIIQSFSSFKEIEESQIIQNEFYQALLGYSSFDFKNFNSLVKFALDEKIVLIGVHALVLVDNLSKTYNKLLGFYNNSILPKQLTKNINVELLDSDKNFTNYDTAILARFLQAYDDDKTLVFLSNLKDKKISRILLIETILSDESAIGGAIDINLMVESGGKLRTLAKWNELCNKTGGVKIHYVSKLNDYLSIIDIRRYNNG